MGTVPEPGAGRQPLATSTLFASQPAATPVVQHPSTPIPDPIQQVLPAKSISLLAGASGVGKTTLLAEWSVRFRDGKSIFGHAVNPQAFVGVLVVDRRWSSHRQWFAAAGWPDIPHYSYQDDEGLDWNRFHLKTELVNLLAHGIDKMQAPRGALIIVDPISMFVPGNLIDYKATAIGMGAISRYAEKRGITILGTAHMAKQKGDTKDRYKRPQDRILGSMALAGFTDTQMYLLGPEDTDEEYYAFGWVPHHAPAATFELQRDPENGLFVPYYSHSKDSDQLGLLQYIPEARDGVPTGDIVDYGGESFRLPRSTVYRYLQELKKLGYIKQPKAGRWFRTMPVGDIPKTLMKLLKP